MAQQLNMGTTGIFKEDPKKSLARQLYQYQNFAPKIALTRINRFGLSESTVKLLLQQTRSYLNYNKYSSTTGFKKYQPLMDEFKEEHLVPYVPKQSEKVVLMGARNTKKKDPVEVKSVTATTVKFLYAIKCKDQYFIFDTEKESNAFIRALDFLDTPYEKMHLTKA